MDEDDDNKTLLRNEHLQNVESEPDIQPDPEGNANINQGVDYLHDARPFTISYEYPSSNVPRESVLLRSSSALNHVFIAAIVAGCATLLILLLPHSLTDFDFPSDTYCALTIYSICSWLLLVFIVAGLKLWKRNTVLKPWLAPMRLAKLSFYYGLSGLAVFYGRDRNRVECHLQDPLAAIALPAAVVCHLFSAKVDTVSKFVCIASAIIGLFICVDFQIWDEFSCHGYMITMKRPEDELWSADEHIIWTMVYVAGFLLLALFLNTLEWEIKSKLALYPTSAIPLTMRGGFTNVALIEETAPSTSEDSMQIQINSQLHTKHTVKLTLVHAVVISMWLQLGSVLTILAFFWTDLFSFLGKAGSLDRFQWMMGSGFACMFGFVWDTKCPSYIPAVSWPFVIFYVIFLVALVYLIITASDCSSPYVVGILTLALPLSTLWWSFFVTGNIIRWAPSFSGETGFTVVGFPIMVVALVLYKYYTERERVQVI